MTLKEAIESGKRFGKKECSCWQPEFGSVKHSDQCTELTGLKELLSLEIEYNNILKLKVDKMQRIVIAARKLIEHHAQSCKCDMCEAFRND